MKLFRVFAAGDKLVTHPDSYAIGPGKEKRYVGRKYDSATHSYPALKESTEFDADTKTGKRIILLARRENCLYPADSNSAKIMGVPEVNLERLGEAWKVI